MPKQTIKKQIILHNNDKDNDLVALAWLASHSMPNQDHQKTDQQHYTIYKIVIFALYFLINSLQSLYTTQALKD